MTKPSAWRAFLRPAGHRLPETSCAGRAHTGPSQPPDMPDRDRSTPCRPSPARHQPSRPRQPQPEYPGPRFRPGILSPPLRAYHEAATAGSPTSPSGIAAGIPQYALHFPASAKDVLCTDNVPPCGVPAANLSKSSPDGLFIAGRPLPILPEVCQRPGSKRERGKETEKFRPSSLSSLPPPSSPAVWHVPFQTAASQRRGPAASPGGSFFGDGESTRGEGAVFTKNVPSPLVIPLLLAFQQKKAGQWPAPAFTGKTKERGCVTSFHRYA